MSSATVDHRRQVLEQLRQVKRLPSEAVRPTLDYDTPWLPHPLLARHEEESRRLSPAQRYLLDI